MATPVKLLADAERLPELATGFIARVAELLIFLNTGLAYTRPDGHFVPVVRSPPDEEIGGDYKSLLGIAGLAGCVYSLRQPGVAWDGTKGVQELDFALDNPLFAAAADFYSEGLEVLARLRPSLAAVVEFNPDRHFQVGLANARVIELAHDLLSLVGHLALVHYLDFVRPPRAAGAGVSCEVRVNDRVVLATSPRGKKVVTLSPSEVKVPGYLVWSEVQEFLFDNYELMCAFDELSDSWEDEQTYEGYKRSRFGILKSESLKLDTYLRALGHTEYPEVAANQCGRPRLGRSAGVEAKVKLAVYTPIREEIDSGRHPDEKALRAHLRQDPKFVSLVASLRDGDGNPRQVDDKLLRAAKEWIRTNPPAVGPEKSA